MRKFRIVYHWLANGHVLRHEEFVFEEYGTLQIFIPADRASSLVGEVMIVEIG